ncbi:MAG: hypothetical protein GX246_01990 [Clostridiales bacterium]|nr:hypothetical protein [Bacillota bacterium]NLL53904.1 hypothetical protein [Clostridiales bacterium]
MNLFNLRKKSVESNDLITRRKPERESDKSNPLVSLEGKDESSDSNISKKPERGLNISSPLLSLEEIELRDLCRHHIDTYENWSRRIIDETFKNSYGSDYFSFETSDDQPLINNRIRKRIEQRVSENPCRFPRKIDAILLGDVEHFLCNDDLYNKHFKNVFEPFFSGIDEVRNVLKSLISIRNKLSHGNTISIREAEQCICYSGDFIDAYKKYYTEMGKERDYNVPVFLRIKDSLGNDLIRENTRELWEISFNGKVAPKIQLRSGDAYKLWVEVDSSFPNEFYEINWKLMKDDYEMIEKGAGNVICFKLKNNHVSYGLMIYIYLTTKRDWHRFRDKDDIIMLHYEEVLPPIFDVY